MLYLFEAGSWIKVGYTHQSPWHRLVSLPAAKHPPQLCATLRDLGSVELRAVWPATLEREKEVHAALRAEHASVGEWYPAAAADRLRELMGEPATAPERPSPEELAELPKKPRLPCCTGSSIRCFRCGGTFYAWKSLQRHQKNVRCRSRTPPP